MQNGMIVDLPFAPVAVLLFLGAALGLLAGGVVMLVAFFTKQRKLARLIAKLMAAGAGLYVVLLFGASLASQERMLGLGVEKHYCEIDCHIAYSVTSVVHSKTFADGPQTRTAKGEFVAVTVRTRFDEATIGPNRGNGALQPNPRQLEVIDAEGHSYVPVFVRGKVLTTPLRPGESYITTVVFDLPVNVERPKLDLDNAPWPNRLLIGHEDSLLHKKAFFGLDTRS